MQKENCKDAAGKSPISSENRFEFDSGKARRYLQFAGSTRKCNKALDEYYGTGAVATALKQHNHP